VTHAHMCAQAALSTELDNALEAAKTANEMVKTALSERDLARDLARDVAFRESEQAMMKHEEHRLLLARQHDLRLQESDVLQMRREVEQMRREVELKEKEVKHKMSQLQCEQGQAQLLHLRRSAEAEARTRDERRKREEESERERARQRENVELDWRLCYVLLAHQHISALEACAAASLDALARVRERFKDVVEQRDLLGKQLRVSLKQIVSTRAQMELERKKLGELSERAWMALAFDASNFAPVQPCIALRQACHEPSLDSV
jgi:hypothetical protein